MDDDRRINIDKGSVDYVMGQINTQVKELTKAITQLTRQMKDLPCSDHTFRIDALEKSKANCNEASEWEFRNKLAFKQGVITALSGAAVGGGITAIIMVLG